MPSAEAAARALGFRRIAGRWRGRCPACGHETCTLADGRAGLLAWCWHPGCDRGALLAELRRRGLLPDRELTLEDRARMAEDKRRRELAEAFAGAAAMMADAALEGMRPTDPGRADLASLQMRLRIEPAAEYTWWVGRHPALTAALLHAWTKQRARWRRKAARLVEAAAVEAEVAV